MQAGKLYFVHLRETDATGEYKQHGGATIAWAVTEQGDIVVGQPARCRSDEKFVKREGREVARAKFDLHDAILVIPANYVQSFATAEATLYLNHPFMTPSARMALFDAAAALAMTDITETMATSWFEQLVRSRFTLENNQVKTLFAEAKQAEATVVMTSINQMMEMFAGIAK